MKKTTALAARHRVHVARLVAVAGGVLALVVAFGDVGAQAETPIGCAAKTLRVEQELDAAQRARADNARIAGLRVALVMSRKCDDKTLARTRADNVAEKQRKVDERQASLDRELRGGDANRIKRAKQKLDKATQELDAARVEQRS